MPFRCITYNLTSLCLGVIAAIRLFVVNIRIGTDDGSCTLRTYTNKFRPFFNLYAPSLIVGDMPMEDVHIVHGQQVDELLYKRHRKEMTRTVKMHTTPGKTRGIGNHNGWQFLKSSSPDRLAECLDTIEHACCRATLDGYRTLADCQQIAFLFRNFRRYRQGYTTLFFFTPTNDRKVKSCQFL